jgi:hypothetical protein
MIVTAHELARVMFKARCEDIGMTEEDVWVATGEGYTQYLDDAGIVADWINENDAEALGVAQFLLDKQRVSSLFVEPPVRQDITGPCYRILP